MDKPNNPQAFPMSAQDKQGTMSTSANLGMTLRDYAVIHYTAALIASDEFSKEMQATCNSPDERISRLAGTAGLIADGTLKEREKSNG